MVFDQKRPLAEPCVDARMVCGGQAHEVARAIVWLLSEEASYTTGAIVTIDGGFSQRPAQIKEW